VFEDVLANLGYPGPRCLQRAVCEMRLGPLADDYGWLKFLLEWALTPSVNSATPPAPYAAAERSGRAGDCSAYHSCRLSAFKDTHEHTKSPHSRQKRLVFYTNDRRLSLPPGAGFLLTPTLEIPFIRNLPGGYQTGMTISLPFGTLLDDLGWISDQNPYGVVPLLDTLSRRRRAGGPPLGTTEHLYGVFEDVLANLGYPGPRCLQRAVCEMRLGPLSGDYGWLKFLLEWTLTPSLNSPAPPAPYVAAERAGRVGDCSAYHSCRLAIFTDTRKRSRNRKHGKAKPKTEHVNADSKIAHDEHLGNNIVSNEKYKEVERRKFFVNATEKVELNNGSYPFSDSTDEASNNTENNMKKENNQQDDSIYRHQSKEKSTDFSPSKTKVMNKKQFKPKKFAKQQRKKKPSKQGSPTEHSPPTALPLSGGANAPPGTRLHPSPLSREQLMEDIWRRRRILKIQEIARMQAAFHKARR